MSLFFLFFFFCLFFDVSSFCVLFFFCFFFGYYSRVKVQVHKIAIFHFYIKSDCKNSSRQYSKIFPEKIGLDTSCGSSATQVIL